MAAVNKKGPQVQFRCQVLHAAKGGPRAEIAARISVRDQQKAPAQGGFLAGASQWSRSVRGSPLLRTSRQIFPLDD
jgi:hypothetical protein